MRIGVLDYEAGGNVFNVAKALKRVASNVIVVSDPSNVDRLIIPGVGSYSSASQNLIGMRDELAAFAENRPILGICLGMQLFSQVGFEFGKHPGLAFINGECVQMNTTAPLPHLGWNGIEVIRDSALLNGLANCSFYFMHSFNVVNYVDCTALSSYGAYQFVSAVQRENIYGVQFHPEKSGDQGLELFKNFISL